MKYYKGFRLEATNSGLSVMVWKGKHYINTFNSFEEAEEAIDEGKLD